MITNGWGLYYFRIFKAALDELEATVTQLAQDNPKGYKTHPKTKLLAALRRNGCRLINRQIVFQVLPHTLGLGPVVWRVLDKCHNTRNLGEYEGMLDVDAGLVADLIAATQKVSDALTA